jgi:uridine kinase
MTRKEFVEDVVQRRVQLIKAVLETKNSEYADKDDVFKAFTESIPLSFHDTKQAVAWEFMVKHLQSIKMIIEAKASTGHIPDEKLIEEKIGDAINYLILIEGMFKEDLMLSKVVDAKVKYTYIDLNNPNSNSWNQNSIK